jgi:YcaO-like protein with predicted kinase domain
LAYTRGHAGSLVSLPSSADVFRHALSDSVPVGFRRGTHRVTGPEETLARIRPLAAAMGITRIGNITGLDDIGIPVAVSIRPRSRSIAVSLGKGLTLTQAKVSALMEGVENFHAEDLAGRCCWASAQAMVATGDAVDPAQLCRTAAPLDDAAPIPWIEGYDLLRDAPCWVPAAVVHTDYVTPLAGSACFQVGSNGLASGNHLLEALSAGICEVVERDAVSLWRTKALSARAAHWLQPTDIDDADCRTLLERFERSGMAVRLWSATTEIGIPVFICDIRPRASTDTPVRRRFRGAACHPAPAIALAGAMTEAAQVRLTYISGSRNDLSAKDYDDPATAEFTEALLDVFCQQATPRSFANGLGSAETDLARVVRWELERLRAAGVTRVIAVDLTQPAFAIPVLRVVIPGLEGLFDDPGYVPGTRARARAGVGRAPGLVRA